MEVARRSVVVSLLKSLRVRSRVGRTVAAAQQSAMARSLLQNQQMADRMEVPGLQLLQEKGSSQVCLLDLLLGIKGRLQCLQGQQ